MLMYELHSLRSLLLTGSYSPLFLSAGVRADTHVGVAVTLEGSIYMSGVSPVRRGTFRPDTYLTCRLAVTQAEFASRVAIPILQNHVGNKERYALFSRTGDDNTLRGFDIYSHSGEYIFGCVLVGQQFLAYANGDTFFISEDFLELRQCIDRCSSEPICLVPIPDEEAPDDAEAFCHVCGRSLPSSGEPIEIRPNNDEYPEQVCLDCYEFYRLEPNWLHCDDCELLSYSPRRSEFGGTVCEYCYEANAYRTCDRCSCIANEDIGYIEQADECLCASCVADYEPQSSSERRRLIQPYSTKPAWKWYYMPHEAADRLVMGAELEWSTEDESDLEYLVNDLAEAVPGIDGPDCDGNVFAILKSDSSLENGCELVHAPATLDFLHSVKCEDWLSDAFRAADYSHCEGPSDGMHVHINRSAMTKAHEYRFVMAFEMLEQYAASIFGRMSSYAQFASDNDIAPKNSKFAILLHTDVFAALLYSARKNKRERYRVVNMLNEKTLEVRAFRTVTSLEDYYANVELVHAIYQFTKKCSMYDLHELAAEDHAYIICLHEFLLSRPRYAHAQELVYNTMVKHGIVKEQVREVA